MSSSFQNEIFETSCSNVCLSYNLVTKYERLDILYGTLVDESDSWINEGKEILCDCEAVSLAAACSFGLLVEDSSFFSLQKEEEKVELYRKRTASRIINIFNCFQKNNEEI